MQSTVPSSSNPPESVSRKRAREEAEEEDLSADIPPQKKNKLKETASLESDVTDSDQSHLILPPPPEPRPRYQTPSPELIPATLPPASHPPARCKRRRAESEIEDAAPAKRRNVAQVVIQNSTRITRSAARRLKSVGDDKPSDGDLTSDGPSSASPSTSCDGVKPPTSPKADVEKKINVDDPNEVEEEDAADSDGFTRFRARLSPLLAPKRRNLQGEWAAFVGKPSPLHRQVLEICAVCVQQETRQWYPRGFPKMRVPILNSSAEPKPAPQRSPSTPAPPPCSPLPPVAGEMYQAGTLYASASTSSFIQLDPELEVPASWPQEQQWVHGEVDDGGHLDYNMAVLPNANLHNTYWYNGPPQQNEECVLDNSSVERYTDEPQQNGEFVFDSSVERDERQYTPSNFVSDVFSTDHQFPSLSPEMDSPFIFSPLQTVLNLPSSPSIPLHSLSKDSTLSPMHGYIVGMQEQAAPVTYSDQDVVESSSVGTC